MRNIDILFDCEAEQAVDQAAEFAVIWNAMTLMWRGFNDISSRQRAI